jgi:Flp pilus assembly pilin Flp
MAEGLQSRPRAVSGTSRRAGEDRELGASALEWAIIAAISVVMATVIGSVIYNVVSDKSTQVQNCATQTVDTKCDTGGGTGTK